MTRQDVRAGWARVCSTLKFRSFQTVSLIGERRRTAQAETIPPLEPFCTEAIQGRRARVLRECNAAANHWLLILTRGIPERRPGQNNSSGNRSGPNSFFGWQARTLQLHQVSRLLRLNPESGNIRKSPRPKHPRRNNSPAPRRYSDGKQGAVEQKRGRGGG